METNPGARETLKGVSIICCTNRERFIKMCFEIIKVNALRLPGHYSLGSCLNFAVQKTQYTYIAKFDDDDYYPPYYLTESIRAIKSMKVDIIGKRAHYMYLRGSRTLLLRFPMDEHKFVSRLPGATLLFHRKVFNKVRFPDSKRWRRR